MISNNNIIKHQSVPSQYLIKNNNINNYQSTIYNNNDNNNDMNTFINFLPKIATNLLINNNNNDNIISQQQPTSTSTNNDKTTSTSQIMHDQINNQMKPTSLQSINLPKINVDNDIQTSISPMTYSNTELINDKINQIDNNVNNIHKQQQQMQLKINEIKTLFDLSNHNIIEQKERLVDYEKSSKDVETLNILLEWLNKIPTLNDVHELSNSKTKLKIDNNTNKYILNPDKYSSITIQSGKEFCLIATLINVITFTASQQNGQNVVIDYLKQLDIDVIMKTIGFGSVSLHLFNDLKQLEIIPIFEILYDEECDLPETLYDIHNIIMKQPQKYNVYMGFCRKKKDKKWVHSWSLISEIGLKTNKEFLLNSKNNAYYQDRNDIHKNAESNDHSNDYLFISGDIKKDYNIQQILKEIFFLHDDDVLKQYQNVNKFDSYMEGYEITHLFAVAKKQYVDTGTFDFNINDNVWHIDIAAKMVIYWKCKITKQFKKDENNYYQVQYINENDELLDEFGDVCENFITKKLKWKKGKWYDTKKCKKKKKEKNMMDIIIQIIRH